MATTALEIIGVSKSFAGVRVLHEVNLSINKGEIFGVVGENGAGKSTLMNIIGGVIQKDTGTMRVYGESHEPKNPRQATLGGIAFIQQELNLFTNLSVSENVNIDNFPMTKLGFIDRRACKKDAQECIDRFSLPIDPDTKIGSLSAGLRQMVEISKGILKNAKILILDEPTTSLSSREKEILFSTLKELKMKGISIIYISHILKDVFELCDRIAILRDGDVVKIEDKIKISEKEVITNMVGREMNKIFPVIEKNIKSSNLLEIRNLFWKSRIRDVSLSIREGEIVGLYGLMGSGRTELANLIFGIERMDAGEIIYRSKKIQKASPEVSIKNRMAYITEDRRHEGLMMTKSVNMNLGLVKLKEVLNRVGMVNIKKMKSLTTKSIEDLSIKVVRPATQMANSLSGGNQQKVVFGKWVMMTPEIFILDEPTRGVDVGAKYEIYSITMNLAKTGSGILFISSEMEELLGVCDRILVMKEGRISGEVNKDNFDQEVILKLALAGDEA